MSVKYNGVKFYSPGDLSIGYNLKAAVPILESFDPALEPYNDINKVLELYNVYLIFKSGVCLKEWDDETYQKYQHIAEKFLCICAKYYHTICDNNFEKVIDSVTSSYMSDFWALFDKFKTYNRVSGKIFAAYAQSHGILLKVILQNKNTVRCYDEDLADVLRTSDQTAELLIFEFLEKKDRDIHLYFPNAFHPNEFERILQMYVDSDKAHPNYLSLIANSEGSMECPISDKLRLSAKQSHQKFWEKQSSKASWLKCGLHVVFKNSNEVTHLEMDDDNNYIFTFDKKWISDNLDYPTLLNNFIYLFGYFDIFWRSNFISHKYRKVSIANLFATQGKKYYNKSIEYDFMSDLYSKEMQGYCDQLEFHKIHIENIFKWFFEEYLPNEFGAMGFIFNSPTENATTLEKCKLLGSEMDGILKQFRYFVEDGSIDRELLEMSSEPVPVSSIKSFVPNKYAYIKSDQLESEMNLLFSEQSFLRPSGEQNERYQSFEEYMRSGRIHLSDFEEFQWPELEWLLSRKSLVLKNDVLEMNEDRVAILREFYLNDVICCNYAGHLHAQLDEMVRNGDLRYGSTFLSEPEQDYFNYVLNKSKFSNGPDLRNKYIHSTCSTDEGVHVHDYLEFLKMIVLIIGKINEEFILRERSKKE